MQVNTASLMKGCVYLAQIATETAPARQKHVGELRRPSGGWFVRSALLSKHGVTFILKVTAMSSRLPRLGLHICNRSVKFKKANRAARV